MAESKRSLQALPQPRCSYAPFFAGQRKDRDLQIARIYNCQFYMVIGLVSTNPSKLTIPSRTLGTGGPAVSALGLGCMGMSDFYGPADESESVATLHAALDAGINLLDTGDFYGMGHNELLLSRVLKERRKEAFVCVKFGALRAPDGTFAGLDMRPAAVKNFLAYTLKRLGTDYIDLYQPCRVDRRVPIEETIGAMVEMKER